MTEVTFLEDRYRTIASGPLGNPNTSKSMESPAHGRVKKHPLHIDRRQVSTSLLPTNVEMSTPGLGVWGFDVSLAYPRIDQSYQRTVKQLTNQHQGSGARKTLHNPFWSPSLKSSHLHPLAQETTRSSRLTSLNRRHSQTHCSKILTTCFPRKSHRTTFLGRLSSRSWSGALKVVIGLPPCDAHHVPSSQRRAWPKVEPLVLWLPQHARWSDDGHYPEPQLSWIKKFNGPHCDGIENHDRGPGSTQACLHDEWREFPEGRAKSILSSQGEEHTHQRKMLVPHFGFGKIKEFIDVFATHAAELCIKLKELADQPNVTVDMPAYFTELTLDIIDVSAFGYNFKAMSGSSPVVDAMKLLLSPRSAFYLVGKAVISTFSSWPLPRLVNERKAKKMLHQTVDDVIAAKLKSKRDVNRPVDLVDLMLDENAHAEHKVTAEEARTHVMTFMLAGHEVSSSSTES
ncbi:hypothetical protein Ae201684_017283 [Aphanomyces euteiches]|uniref:Cytochrome P450 n=1 Tax=Aphanomyces euteiches TaxID=100861 RepID=A0A6G0W9M9_9STRA|nr:hypothetical protein Ae201684_017283 [Aphanomyces euteiches]